MSAGQPIRDAIMVQVASYIDDIGGSSIYWSTRAPTIYRDERQSMNATSYPFAFVGALGEEYAQDQAGAYAAQYDKTLTLELHYWDEYAPGTVTADEWRAKIVHDVEVALLDWTMNSSGDSLDIVSNESLTDDTSDTSYIVGVLFTIKVRYRTRRDNPAVRV